MGVPAALRYVTRVLSALLCAVVVCWTVAVGVLWASESRLVYRTSWTRASPGFALPFRAFTIASSDGLKLDAVTLEHGGDRRGYWVLYFNGAAGSIHRARYRDQLARLHALGYDVMSFDYRGFGRNPGTPSEGGLYADALAAYRYLTTERRVAPERVVLMGRSLGSAVAVELGTRVPAAGLVLLSPIDSVPRVGARLYPWAPVALLASNRFDSLGKIARISAPILIVHSRGDRFIPVEAARSLYRAATGPRLMVETGGGHNSAGFSPLDDLAEALARFWPVPPAGASTEDRADGPATADPSAGALGSRKGRLRQTSSATS